MSLCTLVYSCVCALVEFLYYTRMYSRVYVLVKLYISCTVVYKCICLCAH